VIKKNLSYLSMVFLLTMFLSINVAMAGDVKKQMKITKVDTVTICDKGLCSSIGQLKFDLGSGKGQPAGPIKIYIWRSFAAAELDAAK
jgi:hypothetical protein